jgi:hypothetical protein
MKNAVTADMVSTTDEQIDRNYQLNFLNYPKKRKQ